MMFLPVIALLVDDHDDDNNAHAMQETNSNDNKKID